MKTSKNCRKLWKNLEHKLIRLFRECLDGAKSCVKIGEYSQTFCLKQGDALSPVLSNLAIEKAVRAASGNAEVFDPKLILTYADDIGAIGESLKDNFIKVEKEAKRIVLRINEEKSIFPATPHEPELDRTSQWPST